MEHRGNETKKILISIECYAIFSMPRKKYFDTPHFL